MKKVLFVIGQDNAGKYDATRELFNRSNINDILLFSCNSILERVYYKRKIIEPFASWLAKLTEIERLQIITSEIKRRTEYLPELDKVVITGCLSAEEIKQVVNELGIEEYNVFFVNATRELLYRNYTLQTKNAIDFAKFNKLMDQIEEEKLKNVPNMSSLVYERNTINDNLFSIIGSYFGEELVDVPKEEYQWPIEPRYELLDHDRYGVRPIHMILGTPRFHSGFDITAETETKIRPTIGGIVVYAGLDERIFSGQSKWNQRYGNMVEIVDDYGRREIYAHLRKILVKEGSRVNKEDIIALSGCSGGARIPHLHFEIRKANIPHSGKENTIDPLLLMPSRDLDKLDEQFTETPYNEIWHQTKANPWGLTDEDIPYANCKKLIR